jgi:hypothetical protein
VQYVCSQRRMLADFDCRNALVQTEIAGRRKEWVSRIRSITVRDLDLDGSISLRFSLLPANTLVLDIGKMRDVLHI